jgi:dienelactone hydrolase
MKYFILIILAYSSITPCSAQKIRDTFSYVSKSDFGEEIVDVSQINSTKRQEKIVITGFDSKVPFYHFVNTGNTSKYVILIHGIGRSKEDWVNPHISFNQLRDSLFELGYNIIIPDAKFHGERSYELNFRPAWRLVPEFSKNQQDAEKLFEAFSTTTKDIRILMDFFEKKNAKEDMAFNVVGYSMGGAIALLLNASDSRIKSTVACVAPVNRPFSEIKDFGWPAEISEKLKDITAMYYAEFERGPIALLMGKYDPFTSEGEVDEFFNNLTIKDKYLKFYEAGHDLPPGFINDAIEWITTHNKK